MDSLIASQASKDLLRAQYVGRSLYKVPTPAAVLDLAKVEANCNLQLEAIRRMGISWRAHIKTHKTTELTRLQVGDQSSTPVNLVVSTLTEAENIVPLLKEYQENSRQVNLLYGFPLYSTCVDRLAQVSAQLGPSGLSVMVDHPDQLKYLTSIASKSGNPPLVFLKVNMGSNRAGVIPGTPDCLHMIDQLLVSEAVGSCVFLGVYAHAEQSYDTRSDWEALKFLEQEVSALKQVANAVRKERPGHAMVLSVGATPTATSLQHPDFSAATNSPRGENGDPSKLATLIEDLGTFNYTLEVHAGVYPILDLQQLAAHSRDSRFLNVNALALTLLVEIVSLYPSRGTDSTTEALINAGVLALGREPCKDLGSPPGSHYHNWGICTPWNLEGQPVPDEEFPAQHGGWQVGKITQEHGVLQWAGEAEDEVELYVGQKVRIWPNHACITGAGHAWYLVVDSRNAGREDEIIDVWPRWRGW